MCAIVVILRAQIFIKVLERSQHFIVNSDLHPSFSCYSTTGARMKEPQMHIGVRASK